MRVHKLCLNAVNMVYEDMVAKDAGTGWDERGTCFLAHKKTRILFLLHVADVIYLVDECESTMFRFI